MDNLLSEFPYLQSARAVRLKALYDTNSFRYNYALKVAAAYTGDRGLLFDFITSEHFQALPTNEPNQVGTTATTAIDFNAFAIPEEPFVTKAEAAELPATNIVEAETTPPFEQTIAQQIEEIPVDETASEISNESEVEHIIPEVAALNPIEGTAESTLESALETHQNDVIEPEEINEQPAAITLESITAEFEAAIESFSAQDTLPNNEQASATWETIADIEVQEAIVAAVDPLTSSILSSIREAEQHQRFVTPIESTKPASSAVVETAQVEETPIAAPIPVVEEISAEEIDLKLGQPLEFNSHDRFSFSEWLQLSRAQPIVRDFEVDAIEISALSIEKKTAQAEPDLALEHNESATLPQTIEQNQDELAIENANKETNLAKNLDLIDRFIENNPKIPPIKQDVSTSPLVSLEPVKPVDQSLLMTETLARVYLEQKKYQKAIQAYEILILKYPEKSSFFADRIIEIKNLKQNNT